MNKYQRFILLLTATILLLIVIFPPVVHSDGSGAVEYGNFLFDLNSSTDGRMFAKATIPVTLMLLHIITVTIVGLLTYFSLTNRDKE